MSQKKDETKQSMSRVWKNNWFLIKLCFAASPAYVLFAVLDSIRNQVSIFFEHTYGIGYVLEAAEFHYPFQKKKKKKKKKSGSSHCDSVG